MSRDYKHRAQPRRARATTPGWVWLLAGFALGAFVVGLAWIKYAPRGDDGAWIGASPAPATPAAPDPQPHAGKRDGAVAPKPRFDFYTLLPSMEVVVPDEELEAEPPAPPPPPSPPPGPSSGSSVPPRTTVAAPPVPRVRYLLQVASFRNAADADRLKAQLALLGYQANVQKAAASSGGTWYRVRIGPFNGTGPLQDARARLAQEGHKGMVIRLGP